MGKWLMPFILANVITMPAWAAEKKPAGKNDIQGSYNSNPFTRDVR